MELNSINFHLHAPPIIDSSPLSINSSDRTVSIQSYPQCQEQHRRLTQYHQAGYHSSQYRTIHPFTLRTICFVFALAYLNC
jgi:hypothetical protein